MKNFMVEIILPERLDSEFALLIPYQREYVTRLIGQGVIVSYSLSFDRKKLWMIVAGSNLKDVCKVMESMPILNHIRYEICNLLFHDTSVAAQPQFWLN